jgi:tetratricopeptide (TPR) repeat protein
MLPATIARQNRAEKETPMRQHPFAAAVLVLVTVLWAWPALAQQAPAGEKLGTVHFKVSCSPPAQAQFDRAVALLHSFAYADARKAFTGVADADPSCAMAHWGVAMVSLGNPLLGAVSPEGLKAGSEAVQRAKAAGPKTARERDYIAAIETFYKDHDKVDHRTRALAYEKAMEALAARYPDDREASIFYALALNMTIVPTDKTYANQLKAAGILEKVFAEQPNHPGVAHYLIHSYDYPAIAAKGLPAARLYASIAPAAPHALHMPSHVFTRVGSWQESIDSNKASAAVADQPGRLHAQDYMVYGYLQQAQDADAKRVMEEIRGVTQVNMKHPVVFAAGYGLTAIPARYALERGRWAEAAALTLPAAEFDWGRFPQAEAVTVFARGLGAARSGKPAAARQDIERLRTLHTALVAAKQTYWAGQVEIQGRIVAAWAARAEGKMDEALQTMRGAADTEDLSEKHIVSPGPIVPARELLGEMLLEAKRPAEALKEFEASQKKEPNRFRGFYGTARAAEMAGDRDKAALNYRELLALSQKADGERPEIQQAKAFLARK